MDRSAHPQLAGGRAARRVAVWVAGQPGVPPSMQLRPALRAGQGMAEAAGPRELLGRPAAASRRGCGTEGLAGLKSVHCSPSPCSCASLLPRLPVPAPPQQGARAPPALALRRPRPRPRPLALSQPPRAAGHHRGQALWHHLLCLRPPPPIPPAAVRACKGWQAGGAACSLLLLLLWQRRLRLPPQKDGRRAEGVAPYSCQTCAAFPLFVHSCLPCSQRLDCPPCPTPYYTIPPSSSCLWGARPGQQK